MNKETQCASRSIELLDVRTPDGLFIAAGQATTYWIFQNHCGRFAVQLTADAQRPAFSFERLSQIPLAMGLWMGPVQLDLGSAFKKSGYGHSGLITCYRDRVHLKANDASGASKRLLVLPYTLDDWSRWSVHYTGWRLLARTGACLFKGPRVPHRLRPYANKVLGRSAIKLVWSDGQPHRAVEGA